MKKSKTQKLLSLLLAAVMIWGMVPVTAGIAFAEMTTEITVDNFDYEIYPESNYAAVIGYDSSEKIDDVVIPSEVNGYPVTKIETRAFSQEHMVTVTIPASITEIGYNPFCEGNTLKEIIVEEGNERYYTVDGVLFDKDTNTLVAYPPVKEDKIYTIPDGIVTVGDEAFCMAMNLEEVVFPNTLKRVENNAFAGCLKLKNIPIEQLEYAGDGAFAYTAIEELTVTKKLETGEEHATFGSMLKLKSLTIEEGVEELTDTFGYSKIESVTIPKSVKTIATDTFCWCFNLKEIKVADGNENFVVVDGVLYNKDMTEIIAYPAALEQTTYKVPETIRDSKAYICSKNLKTIVVPKTAEIRTTQHAFGYYVEPFEINSYEDMCMSGLIQENATKYVEDLTIYGYKGTTAEQFCQNNNTERHPITFVALDDFTGHVYSDWKVTKEPTQTSTGIKERKCCLCDVVETIILDKLPLAQVKDASSGVTLSYADTAFSGNVTLSVTDATNTAAWTVLDSSKKNSRKVMYDIVTLVNGSNVQPNGAVTVSLPLPTGYDPTTTSVYYVTESGTVEKLDSKVENGYIIFETTHFSYYAIVDESSPIVTPEPTPQPEVCSCMCHKTGIQGFFYKIMRIFWKLFKTNKTCSCGAVHY